MPKKVKILGKLFDINYQSNLKDKEDPAEALYGEMHGREFVIDINSSYGRKIQEDTLFHEAMHAALAVSGLSHLLDEKIEEAIISCFEHAFSHAVNTALLAAEIDNQDESGV